MGRFSRLFGGSSSRRDPLAESIRLPCHALYVHWQFGGPLEVLEFDLTVHTDPGTSVGSYLAPWSGYLDGSQFYFGLQTDVHHPSTNRGTGKGLIFSTWWSFDEADLRIADDGFFQLGTHEGSFIGVRRNYEWTTGSYRITLARGDADVVRGREMDWFDLSITPIAEVTPSGFTPRGVSLRPEPIGPTSWIGALRFPRRTPGVPARIEPRAPTFLEVYAGAATWSEVTQWHTDLMAYGDGVRCTGGRTEFPRFPHGQLMPNADVWLDEERGRVHLSFGGDRHAEHSPQTWGG
jgi:hypothetical protein